LSAKWRRNKKVSKRFSILRVFGREKSKAHSERFWFSSSKVKRQPTPNEYSAQKVYGKKMKAPEPLVDVLEQNDEVAVVAELVGFSRDNLRINVKDQRLTIAAENIERKYYKTLSLPKRVIPNTICTRYKNGVLEIRVKKALEEEPIDRMAG
jgi:HSP20 family molecular chaperone IbpA